MRVREPVVGGTTEVEKMEGLAIRRHCLLGAAAVLVVSLGFAGCEKAEHPDEKAAVTNSLNSNSLSNVSVSQDRDKGVITLSGNVTSQDMKNQAETLAKQAAPDYTVADEIGVRPPQEAQAGAVASDLDSAIEDNFKAEVKAHQNLNDQSIRCSAKNGTLVLKGTVKTAAQRREAENLAKHIPNVQQVVNEIEVKATKHSTTNS
jgi:hyperosmotically inducible periplasmic protein